MLMSKLGAKEFLVRCDPALYDKVKGEANRRGIAMNVLITRMMDWWSDQAEQVKDDSIKYSADEAIGDFPVRCIG